MSQQSGLAAQTARCSALAHPNSGNKSSLASQAGHQGETLSRMDLTWITGRVALGGGIWTTGHMAEVARAGITHIIDMQIEFDDTPLAEPFGIHVLWNPTDDDFQPKGPELLQRGVDFAQRAMEDQAAKIFI